METTIWFIIMGAYESANDWLSLLLRITIGAGCKKRVAINFPFMRSENGKIDNNAFNIARLGVVSSTPTTMEEKEKSAEKWGENKSKFTASASPNSEPRITNKYCRCIIWNAPFLLCAISTCDTCSDKTPFCYLCGLNKNAITLSVLILMTVTRKKLEREKLMLHGYDSIGDFVINNRILMRLFGSYVCRILGEWRCKCIKITLRIPKGAPKSEQRNVST